jgi:hypothetical protein
MTWAPFAKSPNCASQILSVFGLAIEYPSSYPRTANSERWELEAIKDLYDP